MIFTIHHTPEARPAKGDESGDSRFDGLLAIPEGVAKWALFFPPFWLAFHRLWFAFAVYALVAIAGTLLMTTNWWSIPVLLGGLPGLYLFLEGHQLRRNRAEALGFKTIGVVDARDAEMAVHRFLAEGDLPDEAVTSNKGSGRPGRGSFAPASNGNSIGIFAGENY